MKAKFVILRDDGTRRELEGRITFPGLLEPEPLPPLGRVHYSGTFKVTEENMDALKELAKSARPMTQEEWDEFIKEFPAHQPDTADSLPAEAPGDLAGSLNPTGEDSRERTAEIHSQKPQSDGEGTGGAAADGRRSDGIDQASEGSLRDPEDGRRQAGIPADGARGQQRPITARAKEVLLNILEGRPSLVTWTGTRWKRPRSMGGASRRLLESLHDGGFLCRPVGRGYQLTEAGRAVAESYQEKVKGKRDGLRNG